MKTPPFLLRRRRVSFPFARTLLEGRVGALTLPLPTSLFPLLSAKFLFYICQPVQICGRFVRIDYMQPAYQRSFCPHVSL